jgi:hypothetical protein
MKLRAPQGSRLSAWKKGNARRLKLKKELLYFHGGQSCLERLPAFETMLPRDQLLRIAQAKTVREDVGVCHLAEAGASPT